MDVMLRLPRWARLGLRVVLVLLALSVLAFLVLDYWSRRRLRQEIAEAALRGEPLLLDSYLQPLAPDERNASRGLTAACLLLDSIPIPRSLESSYRSKDARLDQVDADLLEQAKAWLASREEHRLALAVLDLYASAQHALYTEDPSAPVFAAYLRYGTDRSSVLRLARLVKTRALIRSQSGETDAAYRDLALILRLSSWLHEEQPGLFSWLLGHAVAGIGLESFEELQQREAPSASARQTLQEEVERLAWLSPSRGLAGDRAYSHALYLRAGQPFFPWAATQRAVLSGWKERLAWSEWLDVYGELIRASHEPLPERGDLDAFLSTPRLTIGVAGRFIPNILATLPTTDAFRTHSRMALVALAWERFREQNGNYPSSPRELVPSYLAEVPLDLFTGEPLAWREDGGKCSLYSPGPDGEDAEDDLAWRLPCSSR